MARIRSFQLLYEGRNSIVATGLRSHSTSPRKGMETRMTMLVTTRRARRFAHMALFFSAAAGLAACGGGGDDAPPPAPPPAAAKSCDLASFASLKLDGATVDAVEAVPAGAYTPTGSRTALANLPAFCKINGTATPTSDSLIHFELWVPGAADWNGKPVAT